jgi:hypothetical protein
MARNGMGLAKLSKGMYEATFNGFSWLVPATKYGQVRLVHFSFGCDGRARAVSTLHSYKHTSRVAL